MKDGEEEGEEKEEREKWEEERKGNLPHLCVTHFIDAAANINRLIIHDATTRHKDAQALMDDFRTESLRVLIQASLPVHQRYMPAHAHPYHTSGGRDSFLDWAIAKVKAEARA